MIDRRRLTVRPTLVVAALVLLLGLCALPGGAQIPPDLDWRRLDSENFTLILAPGLEDLAQHTLERAETRRAQLEAYLGAAPEGRIEILLTDRVDLTNGFATPFPTNRITLYTRPPADHLTLSVFDDWIDLVLTHELVHIFHLDQTGGLGRLFRGLFGRVPAPWPIFPQIGTPAWLIEGLATFLESELTGAGRLNGSYFEMVLRTAILESRPPTLDEVTGIGATWPGGQRPYIYGALFLQYLSERYGPDQLRELIRTISNSKVPPQLAFDRTARAITGKTFSRLYDEWRAELTEYHLTVLDSIRAEGITETRRVGPGGQQTLYPRTTRDGRLTYASADGKNQPASLILDPEEGRVMRRITRNGLAPLSHLPTGGFVTTQLEFEGPYQLYSDLYLIEDDGASRRLTTGARLTEPDPSPAHPLIITTQSVQGTNRLAVYDLETGTIAPLTEPDPHLHWAFPRWDPTGSQIAAGRWNGGAYEIVVLDTLGNELTTLPTEGSITPAPVWSLDRRYLFFASDRNGIPNIYAYEFEPIDNSRAGNDEGPRLHQVTNLLTGALFPEPTPDQESLYIAVYHHDGFYIESLPLDPSTWREPGPPLEQITRVAEWTTRDTSATRGTTELGAAPQPTESYTPLRAARPYYWVPHLEHQPVAGIGIGATIQASDPIGRHEYALTTTYRPRHQLLSGAIDYAYSGLGNPTLRIRAERGWSISRFDEATGTELLHQRDEIGLLTTFMRRRYYSAATLTLGVDASAEEWYLDDRASYGTGARRVRPIQPYTTAGPLIHTTYSNLRREPLSIGYEDGISLAITARQRWDLTSRGIGDDRPGYIGGYHELRPGIRIHKGLDLPGHAKHIIALEMRGVWRGGRGATTTTIGGERRRMIDIGTVEGLSPNPFPVRGYERGFRAGTKAWSASLEYHFPIRLIERGIGGVGAIYFDKVYGTLFLDAANAFCSASERERLATREYCPAADTPAVRSAGLELTLESRLFFSIPSAFRIGIALR